MATVQQWANTAGLLFDLIGAAFLAYEIVKVNIHEPTIDVGDAGALNGGTRLITNPLYEKSEKRKLRYMRIGMFFFVVGFLLQMLATWI